MPYADNRLEIRRARNKARYKKHRIRILKYNRDYIIKHKEKHLLGLAKTRSRKSGLEFNIDLSDIIIPQFCPILGIELVRDNRKVQENSPTLDRIDQSKGYIKGNVWVISFKANTMKNNASKEELLKFSRAILHFFGER